MSKWAKPLLAVAVAALTLSAAIGTASANSLSVNSQDFYFIWNDESERLGLSEIQCEVTLLGSFHELTIGKVNGALIGAINHAAVDSEGCTNGSYTLPQEGLPWHVTYEGFAGTLPQIAEIRILLIGFEFLKTIPSLGAECFGRTTPEEPLSLELLLDEEGLVTGADPDETQQIALHDLLGSILCDILGSTSLSGRAAVEDGEFELLRFALI